MENYDDSSSENEDGSQYTGGAAGSDTGQAETPEARKALCEQMIKNVKKSKKHFSKAFKRMREDMQHAKDGTSVEQFRDGKKYKANIIQSYLRTRVAALYAKNPMASYSLRPRRNFKLWDGNMATIEQIVQAYATTGMVNPLQQAMIQDYQQGMAQLKLYNNMGDTLVKLYNYFTDEQKPKFKTQAKQMVRRALTCGVAYIEIGFQRELARRDLAQASIDDITLKVESMQAMLKEVQEGEVEQDDPEMELLRLQMQQLVNDPSSMEVIREGMVWDFPRATQIIVDTACENLQGFIGAGWIAKEFYFTVKTVEMLFPEVELEPGKFTAYERKGGNGSKAEDDYQVQPSEGVNKDMERSYCCLWQYYDKESGMVYWTLDGYCDFLEEPATPNVEVDGFWPIYALVLNQLEDENEIYPKSDVRQIIMVQDEWNRARQGLREHRQAARPRYATPKGALEQADKDMLKGANPHEIVELNMGQSTKVDDILQQIKTAAIDPNLYSTQHLMEDLQMVAGAQEANIGGTNPNVTATQSSIAQNVTLSSVESNIDDLDDLLSEVAADASHVLLINMSQQQVEEIVGPGAVWSANDADRETIAKDLYVKIEAGSSGKPNRSAELANYERAMPILLQTPGIKIQKVVAKMLQTLFNGQVDITEFLDDSLSAVAMNAMKIPAAPPGAGPPPDQQGQQAGGAANAPGANNQAPGSVAPMGANNL